MFAGELVYVPLQMLRRKLVKRAFVRPLEHRPEGLDPVRVRLSFYVLGNGVAYRLVVRQARVATVVVGIHLRARLGPISGEVLERIAVRARNYGGTHAVGRAVLRAHDGSFADRPATSVQLLASVFVLLFATEIGFVDFDRATERFPVGTAPRFTNAVQHEPSRRLGDTDIPMQLHRRNALKASEAKVDRNRPFAKRDIRPGYRRSRADGEVAPAGGAPVGHRLCIRDFAGAEASALAAAPLAVPDDGFEPSSGRFFGREHVH